MKYFLVLISFIFTANLVWAKDRVIKKIAENGMWTVIVAGLEGGASSDLYRKVHWNLESKGFLKPESGIEDGSVVESLVYENLTVFLKMKDIQDPANFTYGIRFVLDPKTFGSLEISKKNNSGVFHVFGPAAETLVRLLGQFSAWTHEEGQDYLYGNEDIRCQRVKVLEKDRVFCAIRIDQPEPIAPAPPARSFW